jgi:hypothetical protein
MVHNAHPSPARGDQLPVESVGSFIRLMSFFGRHQEPSSALSVITFQFAGTPGAANCLGKSLSALASQNGGLSHAAAALGYARVQALQDAISAYCADVPG